MKVSASAKTGSEGCTAVKTGVHREYKLPTLFDTMHMPRQLHYNRMILSIPPSLYGSQRINRVTALCIPPKLCAKAPNAIFITTSLHLKRCCAYATGDEPLAPLGKEMDPPTPIFSFCKLSNFSDIMLPNTIEGDVFLRAPDKRAFRPKSRAGAFPLLS